MTRRTYLPVLAPDRRVVLRGLAASAFATLTGCYTGVRESSYRPDADVPPPDALPAGFPEVRLPTPGFSVCGNELCLTLAHTSNVELRRVDGTRIITTGGKSYLIVRIADDEVITLSALCTHELCAVSYAPATSDIQCPCHGSRFTLEGEVTNGPAELPLAVYPTTYDPDTDSVRITIA